MNYCPNCGAKLENLKDDCCPACGCAFGESAGRSNEAAERKGVFYLLRERFGLSQRAEEFEPEPGPDPAEDGYDGYYEDVRPMDEGCDRLH